MTIGGIVSQDLGAPLLHFNIQGTLQASRFEAIAVTYVFYKPGVWQGSDFYLAVSQIYPGETYIAKRVFACEEPV